MIIVIIIMIITVIIKPVVDASHYRVSAGADISI